MRFNRLGCVMAALTAAVGCSPTEEATPKASDAGTDRAPVVERAADPVTPSDTVMLATVATISQSLDRNAVAQLARDAVRAADASGDGAIAADEFGELVAVFEKKRAFASAFSGGETASSGQSDLRRAYDQLRGAAPTLSEEAVLAYFDARFGESDANNDDALDDVEFSDLVTLLRSGR